MGSLTGWTEGILLTLAAVVVMGIIVGNFNDLYNQNNELPFVDNTTQAKFVEFQGNSSQQILGGEVAFDASTGLTLKSSYSILKGLLSILWDFISGNFIPKIAEAWGVGDAGMTFAVVLQILYFLSIVGAVLFAAFKVVI